MGRSSRRRCRLDSRASGASTRRLPPDEAEGCVNKYIRRRRAVSIPGNQKGLNCRLESIASSGRRVTTWRRQCRHLPRRRGKERLTEIRVWTQSCVWRINVQTVRHTAHTQKNTPEIFSDEPCAWQGDRPLWARPTLCIANLTCPKPDRPIR